MSKLRISRKLLILLLIQITLLFVIILLKDIAIATALSVVIFVMNIYQIVRAKGYLVSWSMLFLVLSFVLHFGNLLVVNLFQYPNTFLDLGNEIVIKAIVFTNLCHIAFSFAAVVSSRSEGRHIKTKTLLYKMDSKTFVWTAIISTVIGIIPKVYIDVTQVLNQMSGGYDLSLSQVTQYGIKSILAQFFYVGALMLIFSLKNKKWMARIAVVLVGILEVFSMLSGGRIYAIAFMICVIYIYCIRIEQFKTKHLGIAAITVLLLSIMMNGIAEIRDTGIITWETLRASVIASFGKENPITKLLAELGSTMKTVVLAIQDIPSYEKHGFGASYIETILSIIPGSENLLTDEKHLFFIYNFRNHKWLGGSWIGEAYYNFSWLGCVVCYLWGLIMGRLETTFANAESNDNYFFATIGVSFIYFIAVYARDYFARFATAIQVCAVVLVLAWIVRSAICKRSSLL